MNPIDHLDLKGLKCPLPVLKTRKALGGLSMGGHLRIETTDPLAVIDLPAFCREAGHRLISVEELEAGHIFLVEKGS